MGSFERNKGRESAEMFPFRIMLLLLTFHCVPTECAQEVHTDSVRSSRPMVFTKRATSSAKSWFRGFWRVACGVTCSFSASGSMKMLKRGGKLFAPCTTPSREDRSTLVFEVGSYVKTKVMLRVKVSVCALGSLCTKSRGNY